MLKNKIVFDKDVNGLSSNNTWLIFTVLSFYLTAPQPTLGHYRREVSLTRCWSVRFYNADPKVNRRFKIWDLNQNLPILFATLPNPTLWKQYFIYNKYNYKYQFLYDNDIWQIKIYITIASNDLFQVKGNKRNSKEFFSWGEEIIIQI